MQIIQAQQCLVEGGCDEGLLEDIVFLQLLQGPEAHPQRRHDKDIVFVMGTTELECVLKLSYVLPTRVIQSEAGQMLMDGQLLIVFKSIDVNFQYPEIFVSRTAAVSKRFTTTK